MRYKRDEINELIVDYLENELSPGFKKDLDLVISNSPVREKSFRALAETRAIVKKTEPDVPQLSEEFFNQLHNKVMTQVSTQKPHPRVRLWLEQRTWQTYAAALALLLVSGSLLFSLFNPTVKFESAGIETKGSDMLLSISVEVPGVFADSLLNDRDSSDFYMDAMAEKVAQLEEKHAVDLIEEIQK